MRYDKINHINFDAPSNLIEVFWQQLYYCFEVPVHQLQISGKGLKLIQTVPTMGKSGKIKMQLVKFQIAASNITYSMTGKPPFDDVIAVVMLVFNPEMHSPIHVHCYRCDSAETAAIMQANLQVTAHTKACLINKI